MKNKLLIAILTSVMLGLSNTSPAVEVMPGLDLDSVDGVNISLVGYKTNPCYNKATKTLSLNLNEGIDTGVLNWNSFNLTNAYTLNYGVGTFINNIKGEANINGTINGLKANVYMIAPEGIVIGNKANINLNYGMFSTLSIKETDIVKLREQIEKDKVLELELNNPNRIGILVQDKAKITYTSRIDFVSSKIIGTNKKDLVSTVKSLVYTTTDGVVFNLTDEGAVDSIYSSEGQSSGNVVKINGKKYKTNYTAPIKPVVKSTVSKADNTELYNKLNKEALTGVIRYKESNSYILPDKEIGKVSVKKIDREIAPKSYKTLNGDFVIPQPIYE
jgi:filamentous hemagglutinin family protein